MLAEGWVKLYRSVLDHPLFTQAPDATVKVFIACLVRANRHPTKWFDGQHQVEIPAGAFIFSQDRFSKQCHVTRQKLRTALWWLSKLEIITIKATNQYSLLVVDKYAAYQLLEGTHNQRGNQRITNGQPTDNQQVTTEGEEENTRREEEHTQRARVSPPRASDLNGQTSQRWEEFWGKYPLKQRKDIAARNFFSYVDIHTETAAFACLDRYLRSEQVSRGVVMNPDKWLLEQYSANWEGDWPARPKTLDEIIEEKYPDVEQ